MGTASTRFAVAALAVTFAREGRADSDTPSTVVVAEDAPAQPLPPAEPPAPPFGAKGQVVLTNSLSAILRYSSTSGDDQSTTTASFAAGLDYFLVRNFSIGFDLQAGYTRSTGYGADNTLVTTTTESFATGPRFGYHVRLSRFFSLYPRATVGIEWSKQEVQTPSGGTPTIAGSPTGVPSTTQTGPWVRLYVPLLVHPSPHFFLGFGPTIFRDFGRDQGAGDVGAQRTEVGAALELGGTLGGEPTAEASIDPSPRTPRAHFGDPGVLVLWGSIGANALWTGYDGTGSSNTSISLAPAFDYFVGKHLAFGVGVPMAYTKVVGRNGASTVTATNTSFSVAPRFTVDFPLASFLSLAPQADIYLGYATQREDSGNARNDNDNVSIGLGLYAPLLLHVAPHLFVGFGPSVSHDLTRNLYYPNGESAQYPATAFGASFVLGGWLSTRPAPAK